ncbi:MULTISPECIES: hypothetical protein [Shewanella]|uniref:ATP-binding protein n=1 Tax=bacterium 19CA01SA08 TaxID=2920574 RepID=A0AAU6VSM7_UNCXX|nr:MULTISPECIES: hypothetical protein [Shewanella]MBO2646702.1 hypothetical protein [Shewanella algae]MBO2663617.1 hypothetical protein [Shewanella algae]MCL1054224.1 hypothetical protein [Shewanella algae]MDE0568262.1 hypothetical protein [Shewanella sp. K8]TVL18710.1 hypothetical protein AYJ02_00460 [Shewanella algae]
MRTDQVFGISPEIRDASYVDRGELDSRLQKALLRTRHVAIRGPSKSGKSWLRLRVVENPIVVQCRLHKSFIDIYVDALSQLDIKLTISESRTGSVKGSIKASGAVGVNLLGKIGVDLQGEINGTGQKNEKSIGKDIEDLRFIADIIKASDRRLIIEDFHYMSTENRKGFAFDLKALWDYGVFLIIVGVWSETNLLLHLNPDLSGRVEEIPVDWSNSDLTKIINKGSGTLNLSVADPVKNKLVELAYGNAGVLQQLTLLTLDQANIEEKRFLNQKLDDVNFVDSAAMEYAEQLNPVYQQFSKLVSKGIRSRKNATGIYAHAMSAIIASTDSELINGLPAKSIYEKAHAKQDRIQYGNLKTILEKLPELQVDEDGRGLVVTYNTATEEISVVDRQLLLYRRFSTVKWPWEDLIAEAEKAGGQLDSD